MNFDQFKIKEKYGIRLKLLILHKYQGKYLNTKTRVKRLKMSQSMRPCNYIKARNPF